MHPALILLPLASLLYVATATATANSDTNNTTCTQQSCGNVTIKYPFSLSGVQPLHCGYPVFDLTCDIEAGRAYLTKTFREHLYRVDSISYENSTMVVAVQTTFAGDGSCPVPDFNVSSSLASFTFTIRSTNKLLVFFYNCTVPSKFRLPRPCGNHIMGAYISDRWRRWDGEGNTLPSEVPKNCISVSVPVGGFHQGMEPAHVHYERLISDGFLLEWPPTGDCDACKRLGGECRFVQLSFQCVCPDGLLCPNSTQFNSTSPPEQMRSTERVDSGRYRQPFPNSLCDYHKWIDQGMHPHYQWSLDCEEWDAKRDREKIEEERRKEEHSEHIQREMQAHIEVCRRKEHEKKRKTTAEAKAAEAKTAGEEYNTKLARKGKWPRSTQ